MIVSENDGGSRLSLRKASSATRNSENSGKAVNSDSTTASSGTMASTVVNVRLDAARVSFFSPAYSSVKRRMSMARARASLDGEGSGDVFMVGRIMGFES